MTVSHKARPMERYKSLTSIWVATILRKYELSDEYMQEVHESLPCLDEPSRNVDGRPS